MVTSKGKKYFLIAGETSGDIHGAKLILAIKKIKPDSLFLGHGGDKMKNAGMELLEHTNTLSIMGFAEVIRHFPRMLKILNKTIIKIKEYEPDRIVLIDYPGFNLRLAKKISHLNIPITYFILPQTWAWGKKRIKLMKETLDQAICIFPFEKEWYLSQGMVVDFIGHPFIDAARNENNSNNLIDGQKLNEDSPSLLLLPGSRQQEVNAHWEILLETVSKLKRIIKNLVVIVTPSPGVIIPNAPHDFVIEPSIKNAIKHSTAAIVSSGTATLECAVHNLPIVVCYKVSNISWYFAKFLSDIKFVSMVNLIANKEIVKEHLQDNMNAKNLINTIKPLLNVQSKERKKMLSEFDKIKYKLGKAGVYDRAAKIVACGKQ